MNHDGDARQERSEDPEPDASEASELARDCLPVEQATCAVAARIKKIAVRIVDAYRAEIPTYGRITDPAAIEQLYLMAEQHGLLALELARRGGTLSEEELERLAALGRLRSVQGVPLPDLLAAYSVGNRILLLELREELKRFARSREEYEALDDVATERILRAFGIATATITKGFLAAEVAGKVDRRPEEVLLDELLDGEPATASEGSDNERLRGLGLRTVDRCAVIVAWMRQGSQWNGLSTETASLVRTLVAEALDRCARVVASTLQDDRVVMLTAVEPNSSRLAQYLREGARTSALPDAALLAAGIAGICSGAAGIRSAYQQAGEVLDLVVHSPKLPAVLTHDDAQPYLLLAAQPDRGRALVASTLGALLRDRSGSELLRSLRLCFAAGIDAAARELGVHARTVRKQLGRVGELTGYSAVNPDDSWRLRLAVAGLDLFPDLESHLGD